MIIEEIKPNGFCGGVKNAIKIINNNLHTFKKPVYMLGFLIHNKNIVEAFNSVFYSTTKTIRFNFFNNHKWSLLYLIIAYFIKMYMKIIKNML